jgi:hypothetical protein
MGASGVETAVAVGVGVGVRVTTGPAVGVLPVYTVTALSPVRTLVKLSPSSSDMSARTNANGEVPTAWVENVRVASVPLPVGPGGIEPNVAHPWRTNPPMLSTIGAGQKTLRPVLPKNGPFVRLTNRMSAGSNDT